MEASPGLTRIALSASPPPNRHTHSLWGGLRDALWDRKLIWNRKGMSWCHLAASWVLKALQCFRIRTKFLLLGCGNLETLYTFALGEKCTRPNGQHGLQWHDIETTNDTVNWPKHLTISQVKKNKIVLYMVSAQMRFWVSPNSICLVICVQMSFPDTGKDSESFSRP